MSPHIVVSDYASPFGEMILGSYDNQLCLCDWKYRKQREAIDRRIVDYLGTGFAEGHSALIHHAKQQLEEYFRRGRKVFELPLLLAGTDFQKQVWKALLEIPYGKTATYAGLSERLGDPLAIRAVAAANGANALSLFVPCHRILGSDGSLTGYAGGLKVKKKLLQLEKALPQMEIDFG
jgi:methylated-DNA-[protein]-cysteine S-methyltransferase